MRVENRDRSAERVGRIGSADVPAILGLNPYRSALATWQVITGAHPSDDLDGVLRVRVGQELEALGLEWYRRETGRQPTTPGTLACPVREYLTATPDGLDVEGLTVTEVKCTFARWPEPPPYYWAQARWQGLIATLNGIKIDRLCLVVVRLGSSNPTVELYYRAFDGSTAGEDYDQVCRWWDRHVEGNEAPPCAAESLTDGSAERKHPTPGADMITAEPEALDLLAQYATWRERREYAEAQEREVKARICDTIGERRGIVGEGVGRVTWAARKGRASINWRGVAEACDPTPQIIEQHTRTGAGGRTFRWTKAKPAPAQGAE